MLPEGKRHKGKEMRSKKEPESSKLPDAKGLERGEEEERKRVSPILGFRGAIGG